MLPFNNNITSQGFSDLYSVSGYYNNQLYYIPQDAALIMNSLQDNENHIFPFSNQFSDYFQPPPLENYVKIEARETKARETKEVKDNQSAVSQENLCQSEEHSPQLRFKQKYGRNINSNVFHSMFKKLLVEEDFGQIIKKILSREKSSMLLQQFMQIMNKKFEKLRTYVSFQMMTKMFKGQKYRNKIYEQTLKKQRQFCKIFRILCHYYLKNIHILNIYNQGKLKNQSRRLHLKGSRKILQLTYRQFPQ